MRDRDVWLQLQPRLSYRPPTALHSLTGMDSLRFLDLPSLGTGQMQFWIFDQGEHVMLLISLYRRRRRLLCSASRVATTSLLVICLCYASQSQVSVEVYVVRHELKLVYRKRVTTYGVTSLRVYELPSCSSAMCCAGTSHEIYSRSAMHVTSVAST